MNKLIDKPQEAREQEILEQAIAAVEQEAGLRINVVAREVRDHLDGVRVVYKDAILRIDGEEYVAEIKAWVQHANLGAVIDMGDQAYTDEARFPTGPWCKVGDYVMFRTNTGTRFRVGQQEYRMMNDDSIEAIVDDPGAISRA